MKHLKESYIKSKVKSFTDWGKKLLAKKCPKCKTELKTEKLEKGWEKDYCECGYHSLNQSVGGINMGGL